MAAQPDDHEFMRASDVAQDLRAMVSKLRRRLRDQSHAGDFTPSQVSALLHLEKVGPTTVSGLARAQGMRPQSMASIVAALEAAGSVEGAPDPTDGRQTILSLTDACRRWMEEGRAVRQDWLARALQARLSPQELAEVARAVELLERLVED
jgi:DNA-binding MarR family transcriptional regulator